MVVQISPPKRAEMEHSSVEYLEEHHIAMKLNEIVPWCPIDQWKRNDPMQFHIAMVQHKAVPLEPIFL